MTELLQSFELDMEELFGSKLPKHRIPVYGEFPVENPDTAPFLVTSSTSLLWIPRLIKDHIRAAIRRKGLPDLFPLVVDEIIRKGLKNDWGNVHALNKKGITAAIQYVKSYGLPDLILIGHPTKESYLKKYFDLPVQTAEWIDKGLVLVVPADRSYLGWVATIKDTDSYYVAVLHNPSRGIAVARMDVKA